MAEENLILLTAYIFLYYTNKYVQIVWVAIGAIVMDP